MIQVMARNDGTVHVVIACASYTPIDSEPTSRPGVFDQVMSPERAREWADNLDGHNDIARALRDAAFTAEGLHEIEVMTR